MEKDVLVIAEQLKGELADVTFEMLGKARELVDATGGCLRAVLIGKEVGDLAGRMGLADSVIHLKEDRLADFNPEAYQVALTELLREKRPYLTLVATSSTGLDLAAPLSARLDMPLVGYCKDLRLEDGRLIATSQLYGGKMLVEVEVEKTPAIVSILPGAFPAEKGMADRVAPVEEEAPSRFLLENLRTRFERLIEPEAGDVDITQAPVLVSVGRGIQSLENLPVAQELAEALGGAVSASRPVVDQGWLPLTRQVGRSGMIVKPRLYLALGISGAQEHVEGMRDAELIIAVNTDSQAPIFSIAHYGVVADVLDLLPLLTEEVRKASKKVIG